MRRTLFLIALCSALLVVGCEVKENQTVSQNQTVPVTASGEYKLPGESTPEVDKENGIKSLQAAYSYINAKSVSEESRRKIAESIRSNRKQMMYDNRFIFEQLAGYIERDSYNSSEILFTGLVKTYIPENERHILSAGTSVLNVETNAQGESGNVIAKLDPAKVKSEIASNAEKEWKDDHRMTLHVIKEQTEAYDYLSSLEVKTTAEQKILRNAYEKWNFDFRMVKYEYNEQVKAYNELQKLK